MSVCLTVLMGLPGSGKTTFVKTLKSEFSIHGGVRYNFIHACYDELIPRSEFERFQDGDVKWKDARADILRRIDSLILCLTRGDSSECPECFRDQLDFASSPQVTVVVVDDNMYLRSMRQSLHRIARDRCISYCQVYFRCTVEQSVQCNVSRTSTDAVPVRVIRQMNDKLEEPKMSNKWEKHSIVIDPFGEVNTHPKYFHLLSESLKNPEGSNGRDDSLLKEKSMLTCMTNALHQSDIVMRQVIGAKVKGFMSQNSPGKDLEGKIKNYSTELSSRKGEILSAIKLGLIQLPKNVLQEIEDKNVVDKTNLKLFLESMFSDI